jgi:hypothetical protein
VVVLNGVGKCEVLMDAWMMANRCRDVTLNVFFSVKVMMMMNLVYPRLGLKPMMRG